MTDTEIRFYHLQRTALDAALPKLLERTLDRGKRAVVQCGGPERTEALVTRLWTYDDRSFLPHGSAKDGRPEDQPIWLTDADENPNAAAYLFLCDRQDTSDPKAWELICLLFDGNDPGALQDARARWRRWRDDGLKLTYWQQTDRGWEKKAET